ncbi:hypothetical protein H5410_017466 [Solanum commersonii]|uniref:Uncharacterized protein n=1 Tax=Solanum commersonii TaxID=4109 RepID=A0A9J6A026_SOLCO|nr:hypothetical protein H5410_017466 [Solanum commersonii]
MLISYVFSFQLSLLDGELEESVFSQRIANKNYCEIHVLEQKNKVARIRHVCDIQSEEPMQHSFQQTIILLFSNVNANTKFVLASTVLLGDRHINGLIPTSMGNMTGLTSLNLGGNNLTGSIPSEIGFINRLRLFTYDCCIGSLTLLEEYY